mmetsp:Transcript_52743/g.110052  ORF Transcript_52743/g.110052 Transcript_52743/m.110052 type:complete len:87 (+) Transcript_52743:512-772(+)
MERESSALKPSGNPPGGLDCANVYMTLSNQQREVFFSLPPQLNTDIRMILSLKPDFIPSIVDEPFLKACVFAYISQYFTGHVSIRH